jgi:hypothetical protein
MKVSFLFLLVGFSFSVNCQTPSFPESWTGNWKGELTWYKTGNNEPQQVSMELRIQPTDISGKFTWQIIYGSATIDNRPYILVAKDTLKPTR